MKSVNPFDNSLIAEYSELSQEETQSIISSSNDQFALWSQTSFHHRSELLNKLAVTLLENKDKFSKLITEEVGKPLSQSILEIEKCALVCNYYANNSKSFLEERVISTEYHLSKVIHRPLGVILGIMPWNYPFWQVIRFAAPTLMAGNTVLLKHASNVSGCSIAIDEAFKLAGFNPCVFQSLLIPGSKISSLIKDKRIKAVSFTGSTDVGREVGKLCGEALKKCLLELGGSDPYIIMEDADLKTAANLCVESRMQNNGQSCIGAKRFIIHKDVYKKFVQLLKENLLKYLEVSNNPMMDECLLGPMAKISLKEELLASVLKCEKMGAKITYLQEPKDCTAYLPPILIENISKDMPAYNEEFFGPVISLFEYDSVEQAVKIANDTGFGLGSGVFSRDLERAQRISENQLESGASFVNSYVKSNPKLPFGGIKESGFGRELSSEGILEFVNVKTVCVDK